MFGIEMIPFKTKKGKSFYFQKRKIQMKYQEIEELMKKNYFLTHYDESRKLSKEKGIKSKVYSFIHKKPKIKEKNMSEIYTMVSKEIKNPEVLKDMGPLYRTKDVYIMNHQGISLTGMDFGDFDKGVSPNEVSPRMKELFAYTDEKTKDNFDSFLHSQIVHFYFVYIHPYYDGNGRSARALSSWYLIKHKLNPYTIFLRGIEFSKEQYLESIRKSRKGDITPFLEYMTDTIKKELQKEVMINQISEKQRLTEEEKETLLFLMSTPSQTIEELKQFIEWKCKIYNKDIIAERIMSLLEKGIVSQKNGKLIINNQGEFKKKEYRR